MVLSSIYLMAVSLHSPTAHVLATARAPRSVMLNVANAFQRAVFRDDLEGVFFNSAEFAVSASYYHSSADITQIYRVLFDDPHASVKLGEGEFNSLRPQFQISEAAMRHRVLKSDRVTIKGKRYRVEDYASDGVGVTTVYLRQV